MKFFTYPGQSEPVRVSLGRLVWSITEGDKAPRHAFLAWSDPVPEGAELPPAEFLKRFPPARGSVVEQQARQRGLQGGNS